MPQLADYLATLVPGEPLTLDTRGRRRQDIAQQLAAHRLTDDHEATAQLLAHIATEATRRGLSTARRERTLRPRGEHLATHGGAYLMLLIAYRAQYIHDPRQARTGPLITTLQSSWHGLCGWRHPSLHPTTQ